MEKNARSTLTRRINLFIIIALLIAATLFYNVSGPTSVSVQVDNDARTLSITGPEKFSLSIDFDDIAALSLVTDEDKGSVVNGNTQSNCSYGVWQNDTRGEYTLCVNDNNSSRIALETADGQFIVFNFEDSDATESLYTAFHALLFGE